MDQNPLITPDYAEQNRLLHEQREEYGVNGAKYAEHVYGLIATFHPRTVLDFGCGKGTLKPAVMKLIEQRRRTPGKLTSDTQKRHWPLYPDPPTWIMYDPARPGLETLPQDRVDMFVATDVLEHIEPEKLDETITYINDVTRYILFATVSTRESKKNLPDGRNTHLIVENLDFWWGHLRKRFHLVEVPWRNEETKILVGFRRP